MMWGGMWSSGRHGGDDPERKRCIAADVWRKRFALRYTNRALEPVVSLLHRKGEEYDPRHAWLAYGAGSSSFAYRLRTPLSQVKREAEEFMSLRAVKREHKAQQPRADVV
ncbi:hypothetical protein D1007_07190 [Hordeum vulgare]|nr:hypothetical protein D1007_07190 [Hordeum vulgare]KAI4971636.1 hypothetical protein ZWY2020_002550 [Hordeum vulgare]